MLTDTSSVDITQKSTGSYGFIFPDQPSLELLGHARCPETGYFHYYVKCWKCLEDPELFGDAVFRTTKQALDFGIVSCGCSARRNWTEDQWRVRVKRKCKDLGIIFLGWAGDYNKSFTLCGLKCPKHGSWNSTSVSKLITLSKGCPQCAAETRLKPLVTAEQFYNTGKYHPDTKFVKVGRKSHSKETFWNVTCPDCNVSVDVRSGSLKAGAISCDCSNLKNQKEAYIHIIYDEGIPVALKFGITCNTKRRFANQRSSSTLTLENHSVYKFDNRFDCALSEKVCKQTLVCGILTKEYFGDGYTETTDIRNLDYICKTFQEYGGSLVGPL